MVELVVEKDTGIASELQLGASGIIRARRHDVDKVVVLSGCAPGMIECLMMEHLALAVAGAFRAVNGHGMMNTAQRVFGGEHGMEAEPRRGGAAVLAAFQAHARVIEDLVLIVNEGAANAVVAHEVHRAKQPIGIRGEHDQPDVMQPVGLGQPIIDFVEGSGIWPGCGKEGMDAETIGALDIKLHNGSSGSAGQRGGVFPIGREAHGRTAPDAGINRAPKGHRRDAVRVGVPN